VAYKHILVTCLLTIGNTFNTSQWSVYDIHICYVLFFCLCYKTLSTFRPKNNSKETGIFIQQATLIGISVNASKQFQSGESDLLLQSSGWLPRFCTLRRQWRNRFFRKIKSAYKSKACPNNYLDWCRSLRKQVLNLQKKLTMKTLLLVRTFFIIKFVIKNYKNLFWVKITKTVVQ